ncbi:unnamed protein product [Orchesella dallaii]|uniref:Neurotransmitter-gated ion-channel ligand-binding domain-containing protein n=1 Tax=Orchesella dallaii TaxID=48710 RepID=A0ABP1S7S8_9HEXA
MRIDMIFFSKWTLVLLVSVSASAVENGDVGGATPPPEVGSSEVALQVKLVDFIGLSIAKQQGEFTLEFVQKWKDESKKIEGDEDPDTFPSGVDRKWSIVENGTEMGVWRPNGSIELEKFRSFEVQSERIKIKTRSGVTIMTQRVKVAVACDMHLGLFPFDSHLCSLNFLSSGEGNFSAPSQICGSFHAYHFYLKGYSSLILPKGSPKAKLSVYLIISRTSGMQIFGQMYSPLIMIFILSVFTLSVGSYPFRVAASTAFLLCLFIITTIFWRDIPRMNEGQTALEHYFAISIGFVFQIVMTNILMYGYLYKKPTLSGEEDDDLEASKVNSSPKNSKDDADLSSPSPPPGLEKGEEQILKMGKFHTFVYFKCLKPTKKHLPIGFLIINLIYWPIVLGLSSGLPKGFVYPLPTEMCL